MVKTTNQLYVGAKFRTKWDFVRSVPVKDLLIGSWSRDGGSFLISDANACARGNGHDVGVMTLIVHKFSSFSSFFQICLPCFPSIFPYVCVFFPNKKKPSVTGDKNKKNAAAYGAMALGCGLCGRGSGSGDLRFCLRCPNKSQWVMKTKGQRTNICILYAYYI